VGYAIIDDLNYGCTGDKASSNPFTYGERYAYLAGELVVL